MNGPFDHPTVEAKGESHFVLRANLASQRNDLAFRALFDGDRPNRPGLRDRRRRLVATRDGCGDQGRYCNSRLNIGAAFRRNAK